MPGNARIITVWLLKSDIKSLTPQRQEASKVMIFPRGEHSDEGVFNFAAPTGIFGPDPLATEGVST
jgi:hypothetical protein